MPNEITRPDGDVNTAKQAAILIADIVHAGAWIETAWTIFDRQLPYDEFITARMTALDEWERGRKAVQHQTHWRYGPSRRSRRLIDRDARKDNAQMRESLDRELSKLLDRHPEVATRHPELVERLKNLRDTERPVLQGPPLPQPTRRAMRDLGDVPHEAIQAITTASGIADLSHATDEAIYRSMLNRGTSVHRALQFIRALKGIQP